MGGAAATSSRANPGANTVKHLGGLQHHLYCSDGPVYERVPDFGLTTQHSVCTDIHIYMYSTTFGNLQLRLLLGETEVGAAGDQL